jgi:hypothetical protein
MLPQRRRACYHAVHSSIYDVETNAANRSRSAYNQTPGAVSVLRRLQSQPEGDPAIET